MRLTTVNVKVNIDPNRGEFLLAIYKLTDAYSGDHYIDHPEDELFKDIVQFTDMDEIADVIAENEGQPYVLFSTETGERIDGGILDADNPRETVEGYTFDNWHQRTETDTNGDYNEKYKAICEKYGCTLTEVREEETIELTVHSPGFTLTEYIKEKNFVAQLADLATGFSEDEAVFRWDSGSREVIGYRKALEEARIIQNKLYCMAIDLLLEMTKEKSEEPETDWENVPMNTLVFVKNDTDDFEYLAYYSGFNGSQSYPYETFDCGRTSITATGSDLWQHARIAKPEEIKKWRDEHEPC